MIDYEDLLYELNKSDYYQEQQRRFDKINSQKVDLKVLKYLKEIFKNLSIEIASDQKNNILSLMEEGKLEGWCWETTETAVVFLQDDDYIGRGNLNFAKNKPYYHSWINFKFSNKEYVFDPCLNILCDKDLYYNVFEVVVKKNIYAKQVKDELIFQIQNPKKTVLTKNEMRIRKFLESIASSSIKRQENEILIRGSNDINSPMYRNNTGYIAEFEENKIKKLVAHFYMRG